MTNDRIANGWLQQSGHAIAETIVAMLALSPFLLGIPLLGKQLDIKQKTYEGVRYDVWERTVWHDQGNANVKSPDDIAKEQQDRIMGSPLSGLMETAALRTAGATENYLWRDQTNRSMLDSADGAPISVEGAKQESPVDVGKLFVESAAYGTGAFSALKFSGWKSLGLSKDSFISANVSTKLRPGLHSTSRLAASFGAQAASNAAPEQVIQTATGAILTDAWSSRDEKEFRNRVGNLTVNEAVWTVETPGMVLGVLGSKGKPLTGEAQFGWGLGGMSKGPDLTAPSNVLPPTYQHDNQ